MKKSALFLLSIFACLRVEAGHFPDEIVIVGDSLSDSGNSRAALDSVLGFRRTSPITDGTTWPVHLAYFLGAETLKPSTQGGTNFAYVGSLTKNSFVFFPNPSLTQQAQAIPLSVDRRSPVFVFGGANDFFFDSVLGITNPGVTAANNTLAILKQLNGKYFETLIAFSVPDIGLIPSAGAFAADYTRESINFNRVLSAGLKELDFPVLQVDLFSLFNALIAEPENFGFTNSTGMPVLGTGLGETGENTAGFVFFYDGTHPTEATHLRIAEYVHAILLGPEFLGVMSQKPTTLMRQQNAALKSQLYPIQPELDCQTVYLFVNGGYSPVENPAYDHCFDSRCHEGAVGSVGIVDRVAECFTVGLAGGYGYDWTNIREIGNKFHFDLQAFNVSGLLSLHGDNGYVNGIVSVGFLDFHNIKREFDLGPVCMKTKADTNGIDYSGELFGAYHFLACDCSIRTGPMFDLNYQYVTVDGYKESGCAFGKLQYKDLSRQFLTAGLGWEFRMEQHFCCLDLVSDVYVMGNRQWLRDRDTVSFRDKGIAGAYGSWPIRNPTNGYLSGGVHFTGCFNNGIRSTLGYDFNVGDDYMSEHFLTLGFTFPIW